jgi:hypothetical protein
MKSSRTFPDPAVCKVQHIGRELYECLTDDAHRCPHAFSFGYGFYCKHPDRCHLGCASDEDHV